MGAREARPHDRNSHIPDLAAEPPASHGAAAGRPTPIPADHGWLAHVCEELTPAGTLCRRASFYGSCVLQTLARRDVVLFAMCEAILIARARFLKMATTDS